MKWVVGTGRCGMHVYTAMVGGFIQSAKDWKQMAVKRYHNEPVDEEHIRQVIRRRMALPYPCVTDCAQFMFMDLIKEEDKNAEFVWITRDKKECVRDFMAKVGESDRIHPKGWDFSYKNKEALLNWYYEEVNKIIEGHLKGVKYEHINHKSLPMVAPERIEALRVFA